MHAANGRFVKGTHWRPAAPHWSADWLREQYVGLMRSTGDIAAEALTTDAAILYWLRKHGIPRRTIAQARGAKHWGAAGPQTRCTARPEPRTRAMWTAAAPSGNACMRRAMAGVHSHRAGAGRLQVPPLRRAKG